MREQKSTSSSSPWLNRSCLRFAVEWGLIGVATLVCGVLAQKMGPFDSYLVPISITLIGIVALLLGKWIEQLVGSRPYFKTSVFLNIFYAIFSSKLIFDVSLNNDGSIYYFMLIVSYISLALSIALISAAAKAALCILIITISIHAFLHVVVFQYVDS